MSLLEVTQLEVRPNANRLVVDWKVLQERKVSANKFDCVKVIVIPHGRLWRRVYPRCRGTDTILLYTSDMDRLTYLCVLGARDSEGPSPSIYLLTSLMLKPYRRSNFTFANISFLSSREFFDIFFLQRER